MNTIEEVETEEDELTKQLASFSAYQRSLGLVAKEEKSAAPAKTGIWENFNPWDFNALPSVEASLAELKAGGVLSAFPNSNAPVVSFAPVAPRAPGTPRLMLWRSQARSSASGSATGATRGTRRTTF